MPTRRWLVAALPLMAAPLAGSVWMSTASAASCRVMTVRYDLSGDGLVVLDPNHYDIPYGGCVQFVNQTAATATITVGGHYRQQVTPNGNTSGATNYKGTASGRQQVTATSDPAGTAHGSITVGAAPKPARSPKPPKPSHSAQPAPPPSPNSTGSTGPQVAPTPHRPTHHHHQKGGLQPPVPAPGPVQTPTPTPTPATPAVVAGPIEPASGRGAGLPAALAALAVVGSGAAFVRVLAAEPVDDREIVGGAP